MDLLVCKVVINDELEDEILQDCNSLASNTSEIEYLPLNDEDVDNELDCIESSTSVDFLRTTLPSQITEVQRYELKNKRPTPKLSLKEITKKQVRTFQTSWYKRFSWLTASTLTQKMYCYICLIFGETDIDWCIEGVFELENFIKNAYKHQSTKHHLLNKEKFHMLGNVHQEVGHHQRHILKHNDQVSTNRLVLSRLIQVLMYLGKQELAFGKNLDQYDCKELDNYKELLDLLSQNELLIRDYLKSTTVFKLTISDIQRELIDVITSLIKEKIKSEIKQSTFISIQVDNNIDVASHKQMSIIFRYLIKSRIIERFIGFYDFSIVKNNKILAEIIRQVLKEWNVEGIQVIGQSFDGSILFTDHRKQSLPSLVREFCPYALCIHCYVHHINSTLLYACKKTKQIRIFLSQLTAFNNFFNKSKKTKDLLSEIGYQYTNRSIICHNHCRMISILIDNFSEIHRKFNEIIDDSDSQWDYDSLSAAIVLNDYLNDSKFVFLLSVYKTCFTHVDPHFKYLKSLWKNVDECNRDIKLAMANIVDLKNDIFIENCVVKSLYLNGNLIFTEEDKNDLKILTYEFLDSLINQINERFIDLTNLQFIDLVNEEKFSDYNKEFPMEKLLSLLKFYPFFNQEQLQNELYNIYNDPKKYLPPCQLLKYLIMNGLNCVYEEVTKLLHLILAYQMLPAEDDIVEYSNNNTINRVKSYLSNNQVFNRSFCLDLLAIEKDLVKELSIDHNFIDKVIELYAEKTNRQDDLIYKVV